MITAETQTKLNEIFNAAGIKLRVQGAFLPKKAEAAEKAKSVLITAWPLGEEFSEATRDLGVNQLRFNLPKEMVEMDNIHGGSVLTLHRAKTFVASYGADRSSYSDEDATTNEDGVTKKELVPMVITDDQNEPLLDADGKKRVWQEVTLAAGEGFEASVEVTDDTIPMACRFDPTRIAELNQQQPTAA